MVLFLIFGHIRFRSGWVIFSYFLKNIPDPG